jgi:hypothetical protein
MRFYAACSFLALDISKQGEILKIISISTFMRKLFEESIFDHLWPKKTLPAGGCEMSRMAFFEKKSYWFLGPKIALPILIMVLPSSIAIL